MREPPDLVNAAPGRPALVAAHLVALATFAQFAWRSRWGWAMFPHWPIEADVLFGLVAVLLLSHGDVSGLGLRLHADRGWWHWCRIGLWLGAGIGVVLLAWLAVVYVSGIRLTVPRIAPETRWDNFAHMCIYAPMLEELLFRSLLIFAVRPALGDRGAIITSGVLFAAMHVMAGNPSPENQIAGFVFAWAFLRSGTVLVPLLWHAAGNLLAFVAQVVSWHLIPPVWP